MAATTRPSLSTIQSLCAEEGEALTRATCSTEMEASMKRSLAQNGWGNKARAGSGGVAQIYRRRGVDRSSRVPERQASPVATATLIAEQCVAEAPGENHDSDGAPEAKAGF